MSRRTAREVAMKLAFCKLFGGESTYEEVLDKSDILEEPSEDDRCFADAIVAGIHEKESEIDALIDEMAIGWSLKRIPKVDLSILRVAIYEILFVDDVPYRVSINEAVELAKVYAGDRSPSYINGMLGTLVKRFGDQAVQP